MHKAAVKAKEGAEHAAAVFDNASAATRSTHQADAHMLLDSTAWKVACNEPLYRLAHLVVLYKALDYYGVDKPKYNAHRYAWGSLAACRRPSWRCASATSAAACASP
jgi:hypothetical protein